MDSLLTTLPFFLVACLAVAMVTGAGRASTLSGVVRETLKSFVSLAGGIALLCAGVHAVLSIVQA